MHSIYVKMCKICITFNLIFETHCDISPGACNKYFTVIYSKYLKKINFFWSEYIPGNEKNNEGFCLCVWDQIK